MVERRNVVFITVDAWRFDALGAAPDQSWLKRYELEQHLHTPHLNKFAENSIYFTQALATAPHTTVSHASIMTGQFPPLHGVRSFMYEQLPENLETLAQILKRHGYLTITLREGEDTTQPGLLEKVGVLRGFDFIVHDLHELTALARQAEDEGRPVFAFLHLWDIHAPYLFVNWAKRTHRLTAAWSKLEQIAARWHVPLPDASDATEHLMMDFQRRVAEKIKDVELRIQTLFKWYIDGVNWFDQCRWPILENALQEARLWDDSIMLVFGDHGESVHPDGHGARVFDHGQSLLDDVLRVPLLLRSTADFKPSRVDAQVSLTDLVPTILELLDVTVDGTPHVARERSLVPLMTHGVEKQPRLHFAELCRGGADFSLAQPSPQFLHQRCVRGGHVKVICNQEPVLMKRYLTLPLRLEQYKHKLQTKLSQRSHRMEQPGGNSPAHWYWHDLRLDPHERNPRSLKGDGNDTPHQLKRALEGLYEEQRRGPSIATEDFSNSLVFERLAALGYVE